MRGNPRLMVFGAVMALVCSSLTVPGALAQRSGEPFGSVTVHAMATQNVNRDPLHRYWKQGYGGGVLLTSPFYFGDIELGTDLHRYQKITDVPDFDALWIFAGWGVPLSAFDRIRWTNGFRVGIYHMTFDLNTFTGVKNETELTLGLQSRLDLRLVDGLSIFGEASATQTYTYVRLRLVYVSAGLAYTFASPGWLQRFLR